MASKLLGRNKVIVVEDDGDLRAQVVDFLVLSGFDAFGVGSAAEFYRHIAVDPCAIVILDLNLPDEDGLSIANHVRGQAGMGIIMVTARGKSADRIRGFESGADIYMTKPVDLGELAAAAHSLIRRLGLDSRSTPGGMGTIRQNEKPAANFWRLDPAGFLLVAPGGARTPLTVKELSLLVRLAQRLGEVVPRGELLRVLGFDPEDPTNRNLDAALRRLRLKVERYTDESLPIRTVHGVGYVLDPVFITVQEIG